MICNTGNTLPAGKFLYKYQNKLKFCQESISDMWIYNCQPWNLIWHQICNMHMEGFNICLGILPNMFWGCFFVGTRSSLSIMYFFLKIKNKTNDERGKSYDNKYINFNIIYFNFCLSVTLIGGPSASTGNVYAKNPATGFKFFIKPTTSQSHFFLPT